MAEGRRGRATALSSDLPLGDDKVATLQIYFTLVLPGVQEMEFAASLTLLGPKRLW